MMIRLKHEGRLLPLCMGLWLLFPSISSAESYLFDASSLQGWSMLGIGDGSTFANHAPNPFGLGWDDTTDFPGTIDTNPHSDPVGNQLGSLSASVTSLTLPAGFPSGEFWFIDILSPSVTSDPQWQDMTRFDFNIRADTNVGRWVQVLLNVTRRSDNQSIFLFEQDYHGNPVFHDIYTDTQTNPLRNPYHWMTLHPNFGDLSGYIVNNVRLRLWGRDTDIGVSGKINIDNVVPISSSPTIGVEGRVTVGLIGESIFPNYIHLIYDSDLLGTPQLTHARLNFTGTNTLISYTANGGSDQVSTMSVSGNSRILDIDFVGFDPGERAITYLNFDQVSSGTGTPYGWDYAGGTAELTFAGLPGNCSVPLTGIFAAKDATVGEAAFSCEFQGIDEDGDGYTSDVDCDDTDAAIYPGHAETCDGKDNDCNGQTDEGLSTDGDADGHYLPGSCASPADDCNDADAAIYPGQAETCDGNDNNCNGQADEGLSTDADSDGHYAPQSCALPADDCDDTNAALWDCNTPLSPDQPVVVPDIDDSIEVTLPNVTAGGETTVSPIPDCTLDMPRGYTPNLADLCYDISTSASFQGNAEICITMELSSIPNPPGVSALRMLGCDAAGGNCLPLPTSSLSTQANPPPARVTLCALTTHFSIFTLVTEPDTDFDGWTDGNDNCPNIFNPTQTDSDGDGVGDACDSPDVEVDLNAGLNLFSYPGQVPPEQSRCTSMIERLGGSDMIASLARLDPVTGLLEECDEGAGAVFEIETGAAYVVQARTDLSLVLPSSPACPSRMLEPGLNLIGHPAPVDLTCFNWLDAQDPVTLMSIQGFDLATGRFETCALVDEDGGTASRPVGADFLIRQGQGYLFSAEASAPVVFPGCP